MSTNYGFEATLDGLNNIDTDSTTATNIIVDNITINTSGTAPTMAPGNNSTNIATTAYVDNATLGAFVTLNTTQTITGEKTLSNANTYITGNTVTNSIEPNGITTIENIAITQSSGALNIGTLGTRSGAININTGATTSANVNISSASSSFSTVTIGSSGNAVSIGGATTFTSTTPSSFTFGLNTNTINAGTVTANMTIAGTQTSGQLNIGNLTTRTGPITIGSGTSTKTIAIGNPTATTTNIFGSTVALYTNTTGTININTGASSTAAVNISSGTTLNAPITIGSMSSTTQTCGMNAVTTFNKNVNIQDSVTWRFGNVSSGLALSMAGVNTFNWKLLNTLDTCNFNDDTGASIMYFNSTEIVTGKPMIFGAAATFNDPATFNDNVLIQQQTYPPSNTSAIGYTDSETTFTDPMSTAFIARSDFSLPSKGVWLIVCGYEWGSNAGNTVEQKKIVLSTTTGGTTAAGYGLQYFEEINETAGGASLRQQGTIMGVVTVTGATTIYVNASSQVGSGTNTELRTNVSWTRIG